MPVKVQIVEHIATVVIDRPEALNALNEDILKELQEAVDNLKKEQYVRVALFMGAGEKSFVAGADIKQMANMNPQEGAEWGRLGQSVFSAIAELPFPTIAVIQGFALGGGCELALACDIRIAGDKARFGQPEVGLGIVPGFGGTQRLPRLVGLGQAKRLIFSGEIISASEAYIIGLADQVVAPELLKETAFKLAQTIASKSPNAVRLAKAAIDHGLEGSLPEGLRLEASLFGLCFASPEQKEGMTAFLEKRQARF